MYRVLVPIDDSIDRGMRQAEFVAGLPGADEAIEARLTHALHEEELEAPTAMQRPDRIEAVARAREHLESAGLAVTTEEIGSPPAEEIVALADDIDADLVVLGGRKLSPAGKILFGSVTQSVLLNCDRPVVVTGGGD